VNHGSGRYSLVPIAETQLKEERTMVADKSRAVAFLLSTATREQNFIACGRQCSIAALTPITPTTGRVELKYAARGVTSRRFGRGLQPVAIEKDFISTERTAMAIIRLGIVDG
jgi:hypothetical protein